MTSRNHLARRTPFGGMPVGTGFVGAGDTLATDCSTLKHRRGGTVSWRSTTPTSAFAPKPRGSRRISRIRPTAVDTPPCIQSARLCEPFAWTGTFVARLLQLGVIPPEALECKYKNEIFANEFVLLSYYIASINIEQVYHQVRAEQGVDEDYIEFPGMTLTDTFQLHEDDGTMLEGFEGLAANNERARAEKAAPITVVIMNPPYSAGQNSANDNNQNLAYPRLDERIGETYAAQSSGANKNSLYDSYFRALRWASDRIGQRGVIAFVSNSSFIDGNSANGVRLSLQEEFSQIFIYNLRGGIRGKMGDTAKREGGNVFPIMTGVAITLLVKDPEYVGSAEIFYAEAEDYATRQEKLNQIQAYCSITGINKAEVFSRIEPNEHGDWISVRDERFATFQEIGNKDFKGKESHLLFSGNFRMVSRQIAMPGAMASHVM